MIRIDRMPVCIHLLNIIFLARMLFRYNIISLTGIYTLMSFSASYGYIPRYIT